jgi:L-ascorbate metabolism protein UlaG (beta-lactamase superfamily)
VEAQLVSQNIHRSFFNSRDDTVVTWLGSAGALINVRGTILFIDPLITLVERDGKQVAETGHRLKVSLPIEARNMPRADAVLYTHADGDHFGKLTAEILNRDLKPVFIAPLSVQPGLQQMEIDQERIIVAQDYASIQIGDAEIVVTPALHDWNEKNPWKRGDCCGFLVKTPDGSIWHPGDTRLIDELLEVKGVDVLFFDVARCNAHLGPEGSSRLAETCGATDLIAYHYGTFDVPPGGPFGSDPESCIPLLKDLSARYLRLSPGELLKLPRDCS